MAGESGKKQADNFDTSVKKLEAVITRLRKAISGQKKVLTDRAKSETTLEAEKQVLLDGLNVLKADYETLSEAFMKIKEAMETEVSKEGGGSDEVKKLKEIIEAQTFEYETLRASIDFIKEEHKGLKERNAAVEKRLAESAEKGTKNNKDADKSDKGLQAELDAALKENKTLKQKNVALEIELDEQEKHMETFTRQLALGKNIKTILNKRIDATIIQLEDMLHRQGG